MKGSLLITILLFLLLLLLQQQAIYWGTEKEREDGIISLNKDLCHYTHLTTIVHTQIKLTVT